VPELAVLVLVAVLLVSRVRMLVVGTRSISALVS
jgi:hypothetical protein